MVTTRSAEKRVAVAGKTEDLAVRTKASDVLASPTPLHATTRKRQNIIVNVPPPPGKKKRLSNGALETNRDSGGDDDSPYATAKESPESFRDTETHFLSSATKAASSPTTVRNELESPTKLEHNPDSISAEVSNQDIAELPQTSQESRDSKTSRAHVPYSPLARNGAHRRFEDEDLPEVLNAQEKARPGTSSSSEDEDDESPEIISSKQTRPTGTPTKKRTKAGQISTTTISSSTQNNKSTMSNDPLNTINKVQSPLEAENSQALVVAEEGQSETLPTSLSNSRVDQKSSIPDTTTTGTARSGNDQRQQPRNQSLVNHNLSHQPFQTHSLVPLPAKASKSLESYRRNQLVDRATKRNSSFNLTEDWDRKRRKFVFAS